MNKVDLVTNALRDVLAVYAKRDGPDATLLIIALFAISQSKRLGPMLQEIAHGVQPASKGA